MVANPSRTPAAPLVMLLSVWADAGPGAHWHARLVLPDAQTHEFQSPFALAQFLGQDGRRVAAAQADEPIGPTTGLVGLR